jgi:hypothetical protein
VGVRLSGPPGSATALQGGVWRNNIIYAGPASSSGPGTVTLFGFQELSTNGDPLELRNNLFFVVTPSLNPPLYRNEGAITLNNPSAINLLADCTSVGNLEGDPVFVNPSIVDFHIQGTSPARAAGSTTMAPTVDIDNDARPNPTGSNPDIGSDEVN